MAENPLADKDYLFLRIYSIDLESASRSLSALDRCVDGDVRMCIIRDIIVTYARPFSGNRESERQRKGHRLHDVLPRAVPQAHQALHDELKRLRDELFAHSDLSAYAPKAAMWDQSGGASFPMSFTGLYYEELNARIPEIRDLVRCVEAAINDEILSRQSGT